MSAAVVLLIGVAIACLVLFAFLRGGVLRNIPLKMGCIMFPLPSCIN